VEGTVENWRKRYIQRLEEPSRERTMRLSQYLSVTLLAIAAAGASGQSVNTSAERTSKSCTAAEYRQFDFWIGVWEVFDPTGKKVGDSRIERINDGCAVLENWSGAGGVTGKSLNVYDSADKQWHQFWVDSSGSRLNLDGHFANGKMVLASTTPDPSKPGAKITQKISWSKIGDGSVQQVWETSNDAGKSWKTAFDGRYVRKPG
jgi:hypothetical protein